MTAQLPFPQAMDAGAVPIGLAASLLEDATGGRVFVHGELSYAWDEKDIATRRFAAAKLADIKAASVAGIAAAFGVDAITLWRWRQVLAAEGVLGLAPEKPGPKGPSRLTEPKMSEIRALRATGLSLRAIGAKVGVSEFSVRRTLAMPVPTGPEPVKLDPLATSEAAAPAAGLPVLPAPVDRSGERAWARAGLVECAAPVFTPAARVPLAGLLLALPALQTTGLLECAKETFGALPNGFYGLETILTGAVFQALAGEPRAEGITRIDPAALGRVLGLDRAPEVKTLRRKTAALASRGKAGELLTAMAARHLNGSNEGGGDLAAVLYVDGHVRAYQGTRKIGKVHSTRLKFPVPATEETWVADAAGAPVLVVMAEPGAALTGELRRLLPTLRTIIGDDRRVLVGFDRGGWSPALFKHMAENKFDVLTWRKGTTEDVPASLFTEVAHTDGHGQTRAWEAADTAVEVPVGTPGEVFPMRQLSRQVNTPGGRVRQIHILTTNTEMTAGEIIYRMGARWRQENYFRYARIRFALDSHDAYTSTDDDPERSVPNPAKRVAYQQVLAARTRYEKTLADTDAAMLAARTPPPGTSTVLITNTMHNEITADLLTAETALEAAQAAHKGIPARVPLGEIAPGQQVLESETKLLSHAIRMAAFNTASTLAREVRTNTGYARGEDEAHTLIRQVLTGSGDIDPRIDGYLTIRLDPLPTQRATTAISELCNHLTATETRYPGTDRILRFEIKNKETSANN
ncbi:helix-turn-helix domain-containing protein [Pseudarthrobacter sp. NBSH8]|uniref:helix-turn-helix domain-containing protein n=1 Tax=Pseudarthrobacter sp. NBSH8 TaxID=2596911 RepID=UPI00162903D2|nr:helix-turn-helix domain-containing protein [Pseudarthrobacter sp. NBSH8]QNE15585.1 helix-turn-helix domain-containing protein [Pseudarthrobacter sp. NBSH8]